MSQMTQLVTKYSRPEDIEAALIELNFLKCKWSLLATYRSPFQDDNYFFDNVGK